MMVQADKSTSSATSASIVAQLGEMGKKRVEATAAVQAQLSKEFQEISQHWTARAKSEADLASELLGKMTSARSVPESAKVYQEWANRRMRLAFEDGQRFLADTFKFIETTARLFSDGDAGTSS
jgi:hypothetical protein